MITIQKQRQGVAHHVRAWFLPCPHGEEWHWEWQAWHDDDHAGRCEISYPNCYECYPWKRDEQGRIDHNEGSRAGQIAWSTDSRWNPHQNRYCRPANTTFRKVTLAESEEKAVAAIKRLTGQDVEFSTDIEVYCFNDDWTMSHYPHTASDIYVATAVYNCTNDAIYHVPSGDCLVYFIKDRVMTAMDEPVAKYAPQVAQALDEYRKDFSRRKSDRENKGWLTWLLSEYIKDNHSGETPAKLRSICIEGNGHLLDYLASSSPTEAVA